MLGPPKQRCLDRPVTVSLEDLVPANHFYRHLDATLDLSFVRDWANRRDDEIAVCCAGVGQAEGVRARTACAQLARRNSPASH